MEDKYFGDGALFDALLTMTGVIFAATDEETRSIMRAALRQLEEQRYKDPRFPPEYIRALVYLRHRIEDTAKMLRPGVEAARAALDQQAEDARILDEARKQIARGGADHDEP